MIKITLALFLLLSGCATFNSPIQNYGHLQKNTFKSHSSYIQFENQAIIKKAVIINYEGNHNTIALDDLLEYLNNQEISYDILESWNLEENVVNQNITLFNYFRLTSFMDGKSEWEYNVKGTTIFSKYNLEKHGFNAVKELGSIQLKSAKIQGCLGEITSIYFLPFYIKEDNTTLKVLEDKGGYAIGMYLSIEESKESMKELD